MNNSKYTIFEYTENDRTFWDTGVHSFFHSYAWAKTRVYAGYKVKKIIIQDTRDPNHSWHVLLLTKSFLKLPLCRGYMYFLPDLPDEAFSLLQSYISKNSGLIEVHYEFIQSMSREVKDALFKDYWYVKSTHHFSQHTPVIDLKKDKGEIEKAYSKTVRNELRYAIKNSMYCLHENTDDHIQKITKLICTTRDRKKYTGYTPEYIQRVVRTLLIHNQVECFSVYHNNDKEPVCGAFVFVYKDTLIYAYSGSKGSHTPKGAMYLLMDEIINFGINRNATEYDLFGSLPENATDVTHPWYGFSKFKKAFNPTYREYGQSYTIIYYRIVWLCTWFLVLFKKIRYYIRTYGK